MSILDNFDEHQKRAVSQDGFLLVSASAGSGKTSVLTQRYLRLIKDGKNPESILVLTFSEKAAAEMKDRISSGIFDYAREIDNAAAAKLIRNFARANISTVHGFLHKLTSDYFFELGIDPYFSILSDDESEGMKKRVFYESVNKFSEDQDFERLSFFMSGNRDDAGLFEAVKAYDRLVSADAGGEPYDFDNSLADCASYLAETAREELLELMRIGESLLSECGEHASAFIASDIVNALSSAAGDSADGVFERIKHTAPSRARVMNKAGDEIKEKLALYKSAFNETVKKLSEEASEMPSLMEDAKSDKRIIMKFVELHGVFDEKYSALKKKNGKFDYSDLEGFSIELLSNNGILEELRDRYKYILVDEYQDTNRVQERVLSALSAGEFFAVGDVKQSIFDFRLADPTVFLERRRRYLDGFGAVCDLNNNYRASARLTELVNKIFSVVMTERNGGIAYAKESLLNGKTVYEPELSEPYSLAFFESDRETEQPDGLYCVIDDASTENSGAVSDLEGLYIASAIKKLMNSRIYIPGEKTYRDVSYGDIAVIVRTRSDSARRIFRILKEAGIPVAGSGFMAEDSGRSVLIELLKVADNRKNDISLACVMSSFFGGFSDSDLAEIRLNCPEGEYLIDCAERYLSDFPKDDGLSGRLERFLRFIEDIQRKAADTSAYSLLCDAVYSTGYNAYAGPDARIAEFLEVLSGPDAPRSLSECAAALSGKRDSAHADADGKVAMLTVHAAKGLEFPIVFLADCGRGFNEEDARRQYVFDRQLGIGFYHKQDDLTRRDSLFRKAIAAKKKKRQREEESRLLYVAMTRAKNHLFISGSGKTKENADFLYKRCRSFSDFLRAAIFLDSSIKSKSYKKAEVGEYFAIQPISFPSSGEKTLKLAEAISAGLDLKMPEARGVPLKKSATELSKEKADGDIRAAAEAIGTSSETGIGAVRGSAYHRLMQYADFEERSAEEVKALIKRLVLEDVLQPGEAALINPHDIKRCLDSPLMRYAAKNKTFREKEFMLFLPSEGSAETLVQGVIDLLILGEKNILVDYKTGSVRGLLPYIYKRQLEIYKKAAEDAGTKIDECYIYSFKDGEALKLS